MKEIPSLHKLTSGRCLLLPISSLFTSNREFVINSTLYNTPSHFQHLSQEQVFSNYHESRNHWSSVHHHTTRPSPIITNYHLETDFQGISTVEHLKASQTDSLNTVRSAFPANKFRTNKRRNFPLLKCNYRRKKENSMRQGGRERNEERERKDEGSWKSGKNERKRS